MGDDQHAAAAVLGDVGQQRHHGLAVLAVERRGRLVGQDHRRIAGDRAGDGDALLLAAAQLARIDFGACAPGRPAPAPRATCPRAPAAARRARRAPAARSPPPSASETDDRTGTRSRRARAATWPAPRGLQPVGSCRATRTVPSVGVSMQPRIDSSVVLPLPDGPISSVSSPPSAPGRRPSAPAPAPRPCRGP